jgi:hypothetical protein
MSLETLWPLLHPETRDWLIANNGDALSKAVLDDITRVCGSVPSDGWWVGETGPNGYYLSDASVDWIEEVANGEVPEPPSSR